MSTPSSPSRAGATTSRWTLPGGMLALWVACACLVNPRGNFPLNDDWSYGTAVKRLLEEGRFRPTGWTSMSLLSQTLWGALFCLPAGFSFTALRVSSLTLGLVGSVATYLLVRERTTSRATAALAALGLAFCPVYFALSFTFMSDVPFTAAATLATLFFMRTLARDRAADFWLACLFALAATMCRQLGLIAPVAFLLCYLLAHGRSARSIGRAVLPLAICAVALVTLDRTLQARGLTPASYVAKQGELHEFLGSPGKIPVIVVRNLAMAAQYLALFMVPFAAAFGRRTLAFAFAQSRRATLASLGVAALVGCGLFATGRLLPFGGNMLMPWGIGPLVLRDTFIEKLPHVTSLPRTFWALVTLAFVASLGVLLALTSACAVGWARDWRGKVRDREGVRALFLLLAIAGYVAPMLILSAVFDRYIIVLVPLVSALWASTLEPGAEGRFGRWAWAIVAVFSLLGTHDYLAWNRARWEALRQLTDVERVPVSDIDGGFEFNGLNAYDPSYQPSAERSWWWVAGDRYVISFGALDGYVRVGGYPYARWLAGTDGAIYVLRRPDAAAPAN